MKSPAFDALLIDHSRADLANYQDYKCLFSDPIADGIRYYRKTGLFATNHQTVGCFDK